MGNILSFEEIKAWQKARLLTKDIYVITQKVGFDNDYELKRQIRRAVISI